MIPGRACERLAVHTDMGGGCNRNATRLVLAEIQADHGQAAVDASIREFDLETLFGLASNTVFKQP